MNGKNLNLYNIQTIFLSTPEGGGWDTILYNYIQTCYHSCTVSTSSTLTFQNMENMAKGDGGLKRGEGFLRGGEKIQNKRNITACFWLLWQQRFEKERGRGDTEGQIRHHNNTHAGQQKSISISLAQKSMYGCNFMFFFLFFLIFIFIFFLLVFLHILLLSSNIVL